MEEVKSWVANGYTNNSVFSQSPATTSSTTSQETHNSPTLCEEEEEEEEDTSFNSLESNATKKPRSHFCIVSIKTITSQISCLAIQDNNLYAASVAEIHVFDLTTLSLVDTFGSGSGLVKSISFSNKKIFTAHQDSKIRVWKQVIKHQHHHHKLIATLPTFKDRLSNCVLAKNYVQIHRHKRKLWIEHADAVSGLAVNNDVGLMYSVSWDKSFKIWKTSSNYMRCVESFQAHSDAVNAIVVNPVDGTIYTGSADGQIKVWNKSENRKKHHLVATLAKHESSVNALALTKEGSVLFSGGGDRSILVWEKGSDDGDGNSLFVGCCLRGHNGAILCLVCVNDVLISGSSDKSVRIWRYGNGKGCCVGIMEGHCKPVKSLVATNNPGDDDDLSVFSGSLDGEIRAWKVVISDEISD